MDGVGTCHQRARGKYCHTRPDIGDQIHHNSLHYLSFKSPLLHLDLDNSLQDPQDLDLGQMSELEIDTKDESGVTLFPRQCNGQSEGGLGCPVSSVRVSIMLTPS